MARVTREMREVWVVNGVVHVDEAAAYRAAAFDLVDAQCNCGIGNRCRFHRWHGVGATKRLVRLARFLRFVDRRRERLACLERMAAIRADYYTSLDGVPNSLAPLVKRRAR